MEKKVLTTEWKLVQATYGIKKGFLQLINLDFRSFDEKQMLCVQGLSCYTKPKLGEKYKLSIYSTDVGTSSAFKATSVTLLDDEEDVFNRLGVILTRDGEACGKEYYTEITFCTDPSKLLINLGDKFYLILEDSEGEKLIDQSSSIREANIQDKVEQAKEISSQIEKQVNKLKEIEHPTTDNLSEAIDLIKEVFNLMCTHSDEETVSTDEIKQAISLTEKIQKLSALSRKD